MTQNILLYAASERLRIIKFKIPNEASTLAIDAMTALNQPTPKHIPFNKHHTHRHPLSATPQQTTHALFN